MKDITESLERALKRHSLELHSRIEKARSVADGRSYALSAFGGGDRTYFNSEAELRRYYDNEAAEARQRGEAELYALLKDMNAAIDAGLRLNPSKAAEAQAAVSLIRSDDALLRFVSDSMRRHDYTVVSAVAQATGDNGKALPAAIGIKHRLDEYEHALSETIRKVTKFVSKAAAGDSVCIDGWATWVTEAVESSEGAYERLQAAIDGEPVPLSFAAAMRSERR